jgi:hypothetical protein
MSPEEQTKMQTGFSPAALSVVVRPSWRGFSLIFRSPVHRLVGDADGGLRRQTRAREARRIRLQRLLEVARVAFEGGEQCALRGIPQPRRPVRGGRDDP